MITMIAMIMQSNTHVVHHTVTCEYISYMTKYIHTSVCASRAKFTDRGVTNPMNGFKRRQIQTLFSWYVDLDGGL